MSAICDNLSPLMRAVVVKYKRRIADGGLGQISDEDALADLFGPYPCDATYRAFMGRVVESEDDMHNVVKHPDYFHGKELLSCETYKRGVYRFETVRRNPRAFEKECGFCRQDVLRVAIEQGMMEVRR